MTTIYEETSFDLQCTFYNTKKEAVKPESLTYTIINNDTDEIVREETVTPDSEDYIVEVTVQDNILADDAAIESRKVVIHWLYGGGTEGDTIIFPYNIKKP